MHKQPHLVKPLSLKQAKRQAKRTGNFWGEEAEWGGKSKERSSGWMMWWAKTEGNGAMFSPGSFCEGRGVGIAREVISLFVSMEGHGFSSVAEVATAVVLV
jgi:hypothetical protein